MGNFFRDNDDLRFYLRDGANWPALIAVTEYGNRASDGFDSAEEALASYEEIAEMVGEVVAKELAPHAAAIDRKHPTVVNGEVVESEEMLAFFAQLRALDIHGLCVPRELGGLQAPLLLYFLCGEMIARADVSAMTHFSFHGGMAMAMLAYSIHEGSTSFDPQAARISETRFAAQLQDIASGAAWGAMDITEPDAGSDMAMLRARGEQDDDGNWFVTGQKIFITSGHAKYHFVIARTESPKAGDDDFAGLKGLSMFLCQAYEDLPDGTRKRLVTIERVEDKLGHQGSVTAALSFERSPAQLIGKRGEGFRYMLTLMNNARVGVGFESIGLCEAALRLARDYAAERRSMGKTIDQHEMIAELLEEMEVQVKALRALAVEAAYHEEMSQKLALLERFVPNPTAEERRQFTEELPRHRARARQLTPLLKYAASEASVTFARRALQIHGGVGYTKEYGAEKLLRDALVLPIYEGTSQIQALMAMKDTLLGIVKNAGGFARGLAEARVRSVSAKDPLQRRVARLQVLSRSVQWHLLSRTAADKMRTLGSTPLRSWKHTMTQDWDPKRDFSLAMLHAERLIRLLSIEAMAEILEAQAMAHPDRRALLDVWLDRAEWDARALHDEITQSGERFLRRLDARKRSA